LHQGETFHLNEERGTNFALFIFLQNSAIQLGKLYFSVLVLENARKNHQSELTKQKKPSPDTKGTSEPSEHRTNELDIACTQMG
jgi:hypothetical protein